MEKITKLTAVIKKVLEAHISEGRISDPDYELYLIADEINHNYLICQNVWRKDGTRIYGCYLHVRIKNEKIYVEYDGTDIGFADVFVEEGVPKTDIVLAFHSPNKRPYTEFAVA